jgi:hypothetical protein
MPLEITLAVVLVIVLVILIPLMRARRRRSAELNGRLTMATVVAIHSTHTMVNYQPVMRIEFDVDQLNGPPKRCSIRKVIPPGMTLTPGEQVAVVVDPKDPNRIYLADSTALKRNDPVAENLRMARSIPPQFSGSLAVGDVVAITPVGDGSLSIQIDVIKIGQPHQTVFCQQHFSGAPPFTAGDRVYLKLDAQTPPRAGWIMPPEFTKGQTIPRTGNRVDAVVLANEILFAGAKAQARINSAEQESLPDAYTRQGLSKWQLQVSIFPEDGSAPYEGSASVGVSSPEKAAVVSRTGDTIPIRYDPNDPQTFTIDSIALGWGDPKLALEKLGQVAAQAAQEQGNSSLSR